MQHLFDLVHRAFHEPGARLYRSVQGVVWATIALDLALGPDSEGFKALESLDIAILGQDSIDPPDSLRLDADSKLIYLAEGPLLGQAVD